MWFYRRSSIWKLELSRDCSALERRLRWKFVWGSATVEGSTKPASVLCPSVIRVIAALLAQDEGQGHKGLTRLR